MKGNKFSYVAVDLKIMVEFVSGRVVGCLLAETELPHQSKAKGSKNKLCLPGRVEGLEGLAVFNALTAFL